MQVFSDSNAPDVGTRRVGLQRRCRSLRRAMGPVGPRGGSMRLTTGTVPKAGQNNRQFGRGSLLVAPTLSTEVRGRGRVNEQTLVRVAASVTVGSLQASAAIAPGHAKLRCQRRIGVKVGLCRPGGPTSELRSDLSFGPAVPLGTGGSSSGSNDHSCQNTFGPPECAWRSPQSAGPSALQSCQRQQASRVRLVHTESCGRLRREINQAASRNHPEQDTFAHAVRYHRVNENLAVRVA